MGARARARHGALAALALALSLGASGVGPVEAHAGALRLPLSLTVSGASRAGADEVTVLAKSISPASCGLRVAAGRTVRSFPGRSTDRSGAATWRWRSIRIASDVPWTFTATCRLGASWSSRWLTVELGFPSARGALVPATSSGAALAGAACDIQRVCFAGDPFPVGQCTWYAAGRRPDLVGIVHGDAGTWLADARGRVPEGWFPVVGALAVWLPHTDGVGEAGHVGYVAAVSDEGRILLDDSNWTPTPTSPGLEVHEHWESASSPSGYIYGGPAGAGRPS